MCEDEQKRKRERVKAIIKLRSWVKRFRLEMIVVHRYGLLI